MSEADSHICIQNSKYKDEQLVYAGLRFGAYDYSRNTSETICSRTLGRKVCEYQDIAADASSLPAKQTAGPHKTEI